MQQPMWSAWLVLGTLGVLGGSSAVAQGPYVPPTMNNPYARPVFSPYLNLARGLNPGINYFGVVQPQLQTSTALQQLQQLQLRDAADLQAAVTTGALGGVPVTGVRASYMNFSHYYGGRVAGSAVLPPVAAAPAVTPLATTGVLTQVGAPAIGTRGR